MDYRIIAFFVPAALALFVSLYVYVNAIRKYLRRRRGLDVSGMRYYRRKTRRSFTAVLLVIALAVLIAIMVFDDYFRHRPILLTCFVFFVLMLVLWIFLLVILDVRELRALLKEGKAFEILSKSRRQKEDE
jgi:hypothetical protein